MGDNIVPAKLWWRNRVRKEPLSSIALQYNCSKNKIKLIVTAYRWKRGEVVMSRQWMIDRMKDGYTVCDMAKANQCGLSTVYGHLREYGLGELYRKMRPRGPGNPRLMDRREP